MRIPRQMNIEPHKVKPSVLALELKNVDSGISTLYGLWNMDCGISTFEYGLWNITY